MDDYFNQYVGKKCWLCGKAIYTKQTPQWDVTYRTFIDPLHVCGVCFSKDVNRTYDKVFHDAYVYINWLLQFNKRG